MEIFIVFVVLVVITGWLHFRIETVERENRKLRKLIDSVDYKIGTDTTMYLSWDQPCSTFNYYVNRVKIREVLDDLLEKLGYTLQRNTYSTRNFQLIKKENTNGIN